MQPTPTPPPAPWERQPYDTSKSWQAFTVYRDLGSNRALSRAAAALGRNAATLADWSRLHRWAERVAAWDAEADRVRRVAMLAEVEQMAIRHAQQARSAQNAAMVPVSALIERLAQTDPASLLEFVRSDELLSLALEAIRTLPASQGAERLARGEPTEIVSSSSISATVVAGPVGLDRLGEVLDALAAAGVKLGLPVPDDDAPPSVVVVDAAEGPAT